MKSDAQTALDTPQPGSTQTMSALVFFICITAYTIDACIPALPDAAKALGVSSADIQLAITFYLVGFTLAQIPVGMMSDRLGRLPVAFGGLLLFCLAGLAGGMAEDLTTLLAARFVQGLGGACGPLLARAIARDISAGSLLVKRMSTLNTALATSTLTAPILGSLLIGVWGWRAPFLSTVVLGVFSALLLTVLVKETRPRATDQGAVWGQLVESFRTCIHNPQVFWGSTLIGIVFLGYMVVLASFSPILSDVYGIATTRIGLLFGMVLGFYIIGTTISRFSKASSMKQIKAGVIIFVLGALGMLALLISGNDSLWVFMGVLMPFLLGMGLVMPNANAIALAPLGKTAGFGSAIIGTFQMTLASLGTLSVVLLYDQTIVWPMVVILLSVTLMIGMYWYGRSWVQSP